MDVFESSTREKMPALRSFVAVAGENVNVHEKDGRTNFLHQGIKLFLGTQRNDEHLGRCDDRWK